MTKAERQEFNELKAKIEDLQERVLKHNAERQALIEEKKALKKALRELEKKYA